ncbi:MAG: MarR family winged helix-turn-helix transcriptional regulator [Planctomycetota bacterium]
MSDVDWELDELPSRLGRTCVAAQQLIAQSLKAQGLAKLFRPGMGLVMFALYKQDGMIIRDIARRARVSHVAVLQMAARMERAGLVKRANCPDDRRATRVWLTPLGRSLRPRLAAVHRCNVDVLTAVLGARDAARLNDLLGRLLEGLDAGREGAGNGETPSRKRTRTAGASRGRKSKH